MKELYKVLKDHKNQHMQDLDLSLFWHCYKEEARKVIGDDIDLISTQELEECGKDKVVRVTIINWHKSNTLIIVFNHVTGKKNVFFRGCGWPNKAVSWCAEDKLWITVMNQLFESLYGKDTLKYMYVPGQGTKVHDCDNPIPVFYYDQKVWGKIMQVMLLPSSQISLSQ